MTSPDSHHDRHVEALLAAARGGAVPEIEPDESAGEWALREARLRQARALVNLRRRAAPPVLDGFVVAALQAGVREARAVHALREVAARGPQAAPAALDRQVAASIDRLRAPRALDTRIAERLALPGAGVAQSLLGRLSRVAAPDDLAARLAEPGASGTAGLAFVAPRGRGRFGRFAQFWPVGRRQKFAWIAAGALLLFVLGGLFGRGDEAAASDWHSPVGLRAQSKRAVAHVEPVRPRLALTFEFVPYASHLEAPLTPELIALVSGLVGEPVEGGS